MMCEIVKQTCAHCGHLIVGWDQPGGQAWAGIGVNVWHIEFTDCRQAYERQVNGDGPDASRLASHSR